MDKKELIGFILNDIKELELIAKGMHEMDKIPGVMQELAISKTQNILDRFLRLRADSFVGEPEKVEPKPVVHAEEKTEEKIQIEQPPAKKIPEKLEPQQEEMVELIVEEQEVVLFQEIEPEEKAAEEEESKISESEILKSEISAMIQPVDQQPEEEKGTVFAGGKVKVQERTTNEKFKSRTLSANTAVTTGKRAESRFIQNLRKAINLNDRYRYQRELFGGNGELMNSVIDKLDTMNSLEEAVTYVRTEFIWDAESETVTDFYLLLESRFS